MYNMMCVLFHLMQATGYLHHYSYFTDDLRLKARNEMFLKDLYKVKECSECQTNIFLDFLDVLKIIGCSLPPSWWPRPSTLHWRSVSSQQSVHVWIPGQMGGALHCRRRHSPHQGWDGEGLHKVDGKVGLDNGKVIKFSLKVSLYVVHSCHSWNSSSS